MPSLSSKPDRDSAPETAAPPSSATNRPAPARLLQGLRVVSAMTLLSRVFGLVRDIGMASLFGLSEVQDAFTFAFRVPNLFRKMFGEGALATAFVPILARDLEQPDRSDAWRLIRAVCTVLTLFLSALVLIAEVGLWLASRQPGLSEATSQLLAYTAVLLPYVVAICLASQMAAALNALGHFSWPATLPVALNLVWIGGIWWLAPQFSSPTDQAFVIACCIVATGVLQVLMQVPMLHAAGYRYLADWRRAMPEVVEIARVMLPVIVGMSITQLNAFGDSLIAWCFTEPQNSPGAVLFWAGGPHYPLRSGAVTALSYGERMYQFPLGVFGVALGTVLFPLLARHAARGELKSLRNDLTLGLRLVIVIGIPASAGLMILAHPITRALFQHGKFDPADSWRTAKVIAAYGSGVWAYCGVLILQRGFYALKDRMTPVRIGVVAVSLNLVCNLVLIWPFAELGLALSTALGAGLQVALLARGLERHVGTLAWKELGSTALRTIVAASVMSAVGIATIALCDSRVGKIGGLLLPCTAATLAYLACAKLCRLDELWLLFGRDDGERREPPE